MLCFWRVQLGFQHPSQAAHRHFCHSHDWLYSAALIPYVQGLVMCIVYIAHLTFHGFIQWVKEEAPDILCLQETKCSENKLPAELQDLPGLTHQYWSAPSDKEGYSGVGLLSRQCPLKVSYGIGETLLSFMSECSSASC